EGASDTTLEKLKKELKSHETVLKVSYTSKAVALEEFGRYMEGNDLLIKGLGENPLPASFEVTLKEEYRTAGSVRGIAQEMKGFRGVNDVQYGQEWVDNINAILQIFRVGAVFGGVILGLAAMVIISNTIGLTVWARLSEIEVLKMVGATRWYIQTPFLLEGGILGLIGGGFSLFFLHLIFLFGQNRLAETGGFLGQNLVLNFLPPQWLGLFLAAGVFLGFAGGLISTRRLV
ncbi:MAG TPA: permease-like cell division protein FtsX, partial [Nitrospiria bacterium]